MNEIEKINNLTQYYNTFIGKLLVRKPFSGVNKLSKTPLMLVKDVESREGLQWTGVWSEPIDGDKFFLRLVINEAEPFMLMSVILTNDGRSDFKLNVWFQILQNDIIGWIKPCEAFPEYALEIPHKEFIEKYELFTMD